MVDFCMSLATTLVHDSRNAGFQENAQTSPTTIVGIRLRSATSWVFDQNLLGSFNVREFKGRMRMDVSVFEFLSPRLQPSCKGMIQTYAMQYQFKLR